MNTFIQHACRMTSVLTLFLLSCPLLCAANYSTLDSQIKSEFAQKLPQAHWGMILKDASTGTVIYQYQAEQAFAPASTAKLFTSVAALSYLGDDFRYTTSITSTSTMSNQNITDNVYLKFTGDPSLTHTDVNNLIAQLTKSGINTIAGNFVIDASTYTSPYYPLGITLDDLPFCYGTLVSANIIDHNCLFVTLTTKTENNIEKTTLTHNNPWVKVNNNIQWLNDKNSHYCVFSPELHTDNVIDLNGCLPKNASWNLSLALPNPNLFTMQLVKADLLANHIKLKGQIIFGKAPNNATQLLAQHTSAPLATLLVTMLKQSDNLYAESITKTLGNAYYSVGNNKSGVNAIKAILTPLVNINFNNMPLEDGAGGSNYDQISPTQLASLLQTVYNTPNLAEVIVSALPTSGQDGTLANRMQDTNIQGKVFAKTGTLTSTGVSNIAGYLLTKDNHTFIFVIMINNTTAPPQIARNVQDNILQTIYTLSSS